jgi:hypothetical protein
MNRNPLAWNWNLLLLIILRILLAFGPSDSLAQNPLRSQGSLIPLQIVIIILENYPAQ